MDHLIMVIMEGWNSEKDGENMTITAGTYKIVFNLANLTYTIENFTWGLVGDATTNGWDGPDMPMTYDSSSDTWKIIATLKEGKNEIPT